MLILAYKTIDPLKIMQYGPSLFRVRLTMQTGFRLKKVLTACVATGLMGSDPFQSSEGFYVVYIHSAQTPQPIANINPNCSLIRMSGYSYVSANSVGGGNVLAC